MKMKKKQDFKEKSVDRRAFLKGVATASGAAALAAGGQASAAAPGQAPGTSKGYQETGHVRDYYKSARF